MAMIPSSEALVTISLLALSIFCAFRLAEHVLQRSAQSPLPPGPEGLPVIGNVHQLPKSYLWKKYLEWSRKFGPVFHLRMFTNHLIILNSPESINELLEKRSAIYSDRPQPYMHNEIVGRKYVVFNVSSENERFRKYRRILREELDSRASKRYGSVMQEEALVLLRGLKATPENFLKLIRMNAVSLILKLSYGYVPRSEDDFFLKTIENASQIFAQTSRPGRWVVDYYPLFRFIPSWLPFPGGNFKRLGRQFRDDVEGLRNVPHMWVKEQMENGDYIPSFSSRYLAPEDSHVLTEEEEDIVKNLASALYLGGGDTTVSSLSTFFLAMTLYPSVQKRAQKEVDEFIGRHRLPNVDDFETGDLKYVNAVIREVLRWGVVGPLGIPHRVTREDLYLGYRIPKHATVVANIWAVMRDERYFPRPDEFRPERHLGRDNLPSAIGIGGAGAVHEEYLDPMNYAFGFGRRICPGFYFAHLSLFLSFTSILQVFNITKEIREDGTEVEPVAEFTSGVTRILCVAYLVPVARADCVEDPFTGDVRCNGLSQGARIGIAIAISVGFIVLGTIFALIRRRRIQRENLAYINAVQNNAAYPGGGPFAHTVLIPVYQGGPGQPPQYPAQAYVLHGGFAPPSEPPPTGSPYYQQNKPMA